MKRNISQFTTGPYDLLVIGGGINGAAIANTAAYNGMRVALLERNDFASGTSSKSTKLVHGGLRYLENFELDLVKESLLERNILLKSAPHLVKPLSFIFPVYENDQRPLWKLKLGVSLYDLLSGSSNIHTSGTLNKKEILQMVPGIKSASLQGGVIYYDAQMDDARLCLENVLNARHNGADVANYMDVKSLIKENGKTVAVVAKDLVTKEEIEIRAENFVCAAGPWTNEFMQKERNQAPPKIRTTKGVHIVYRGQFSKHAMFIPVKEDGRVFFVIPFYGNTLIGTTDTDYSGDLNKVEVFDEDIDYLFNAIKRVFPKRVFLKENIIDSFAGLRPLVQSEGDASKISRKHSIEESYSGIYYVLGGKYTTFRKIAEDAVKKIAKRKLKNTRRQFPLYGQGDLSADAYEVAKDFNISVDIVVQLMGRYGAKYIDVLNLVKADASLKTRICSCTSVIRAQILYAIETEMALSLDDIVMRRLSLNYQLCRTKDCYKEVKKLLKKQRSY